MANMFTILVLLGMLSHVFLAEACSCVGCTDTTTVSSTSRIKAGSCSNGKMAAVRDLDVQSTDGSVFQVFSSLYSSYSTYGDCVF